MNFFKLILIDTIADALYFPIWWYSKGLVLTFKWVLQNIAETQNFLALSIWIKNLFKPMYGQSDWQGRTVSFFVRIFQIIFRSVFFLGFSLFYIALLIAYTVLPLFVIYMILLHLPRIL